MTMRIALAGNPNSGKTTLFNALTGSRQRVGNRPGVTVDKKEGVLKGHPDFIIEDLPGIYSLSPYTPEEVVSRRYLIENKPDLIVNVVDGSNLSRNLYLTCQLLELGIPTIIAMNMMDLAKKKGDVIDLQKMGAHFGCPIIPIVASRQEGLDKLVGEIEKENKKSPKPLDFSADFEKTIEKNEVLLKDKVPERLLRYYAVKAFEDDRQILKNVNLTEGDFEKIGKIRQDLEGERDDIAESIVTTERYDSIEAHTRAFLKPAPPKESLTDKIDRSVTGRFTGLPVFLLVMWLVYYIAISKVGTPLTDLVNNSLSDRLLPAIEGALLGAGINDVLVGLICGGALNGMFAVLGFLPQMLVLFALLSLLEDIGYMARVAFVMDRIFRKFGLSGKSFIPMMIGTGCSVPGIQASRTIENDRDRRITIMTTSFMPCSAKLPVIALVAGAFFPGHEEAVTYSMYLIGITAVVISGIILKKFKSLASEPAPFVMELPAYHLPSLKSVLKDVYDKGMAFIKRAGTVIVVSAMVLWVLGNFDPSFHLLAEENGEGSILARMGAFIAPIFIPLGFGSRQATVATITGFIAKENVLATLGVVLGLGADVTEESLPLLQTFGASLASPLAGYSFLLFNMLCMPCFAAVGAIRTEMNSGKWTLGTIAYQMGFAYCISLMVYQLGSFFIYGKFSGATIVAFLVLLIFIYLLARKNKFREDRAIFSKMTRVA